MASSAWLWIAVAACAAPKPAAEPASNTSSAHGRAPVALAIVFSGMELWTGNDDFETDPNATYGGALHDLERGVDALALPPGSAVTVIAYSTGAKVVVPWTRADQLHGRQLGDQLAYRNAIGIDLVQGVMMGLSQLAQRPEPRKALLVIGDGNDTASDLARDAITTQAQRAALAHVVTRAVIWKSVVSDDKHELVSRLAPLPRAVTAPRELEAAIAAAAGELAP